MKKLNKDKKQTDSNSSKGVKLPLIQSNVQKGKLKEPQGNSSKSKALDQKNNSKEKTQMPNIPLTKNIPKKEKSFTSNSNQNKTKGNTEVKKKNNLNNDNTQEDMPKFTEEKLFEIKEKRKQRIKQEKKEEEKQIKLYSKLLQEFKNNAKSKNSKNPNQIIEDNPKIIISSKKAQNILEEGGMFDAYKHLLAELCKNGLPNGNIFDYASYVVKNYEKKWKEKKSQMMKDKIDKYYEEKQKEINKSLETDGQIKIVNKSLEHRDELKFIQNLDKSRSGRNVVPIIDNSSPKLGKITKNPKNNGNSNKNEKKENQQNIINENNNIKAIKLKESSAEKNNKINKNLNENKSKEKQSSNSSNKKNIKKK